VNGSITLAVLAGVFGTIGLATAIYGGWRLTLASRELISGLKGIGKIAESNKELVETSRQVATELQLLRSLMAANAGEPGKQDPREGEAPPSPPRPRVPFPTPGFEMGRIIPDAVVSDTDIVDTTDDQLVALERLEELRLQGYDADAAELEGE
jgi:hypothetical protein